MNNIRRMDLTFALATVLVVMLSGGAAFKLHHQHEAQTSRNVQDLAQLREQVRTTRANLHQLEQADRYAQQYRTEISQRALSERDFGPFLDQVYELARAEGIRLVELKQQPASASRHENHIPLRLEARGESKELHRFLHTLETLDAILQIHTLRLQAVPATDDAALTLHAYVVMS